MAGKSSTWKRPFVNFAKVVRSPFRKFKLILKQRLGWLGNPKILPFNGYGNDNQVFIKGHVLEDNGLAKAVRSEQLLSDMWAMLKRFASDEIPDVHVHIRFLGMEKTVLTDEDGFFDTTIDVSNLELPYYGWHEAEFILMDNIKEGQGEILAKGEAIIPSVKTSQYGLISDIDDTILISHATDFIKKMHLMLTRNARTRMPFEGVSAFYKALSQGRNVSFNNPVFYVSSSEYNLYDLLYDFCRNHHIPNGVFLLEDIKSNLWQLLKGGSGNHHSHKYGKIKKLLSTYPELNFILVGDSGQKDAEIYSDIAQEFPGRILTIYIRDVKKSRHTAVQKIANELNAKNMEMLLVKNTLEAAEHAVLKGYIPKGALRKIRSEKELDEQAPSDFDYVIRPK